MLSGRCCGLRAAGEALLGSACAALCFLSTRFLFELLDLLLERLQATHLLLQVVDAVLQLHCAAADAGRGGAFRRQVEHILTE